MVSQETIIITIIHLKFFLIFKLKKSRNRQIVHYAKVVLLLELVVIINES